MSVAVTPADLCWPLFPLGGRFVRKSRATHADFVCVNVYGVRLVVCMCVCCARIVCQNKDDREL